MRARVAGLAGLALGAGLAGSGAALAQYSPVPGSDVQTLTLSAISDEIDYDTDMLRADPGRIRIVMRNPSILRHNISLQGGGLDQARLGPVVGQGEASTLEVSLPAGRYTFFCVVGAHASLGMRGTLVVGQSPPGAGGGGVTLSAAQLRINQRISQAAIRRLNRLDALLDGRPVPERVAGSGGGGEITLSVAQLRINQRIAQAAVRRANAIDARLEGRPPPPPPDRTGGGEITLSAGQLLINQRISQAAVRRANALEPRVAEVVAARA